MNLTYWIILGIGALLSLAAQAWVNARVNKWAQVGTRRGLTGADTAAAILRAEGIRDVRIESIGGFLSDHYDPADRVLRLSPEIYSGRSVTAAGIAAHEVGHALQHAQGYWPMTIRQKLVPVAKVGTGLGLWITIIGLLIGLTGLATVGVALFGGFVLFTLITLPVEFDASLRARKVLEKHRLLDPLEIKGVKEVLSAAAATYVAAAAAAVLQLLYWLSVLSGRRH